MLSVEEKARCLEKGVFGALEAAARLALAERMGERQIEDGQTLFMEGEPGSHVFVIVSGEVEVRRGETVLAVLGPGELIGEMAVLGSGLRTASARARGTARFLFLKDRAIRLLIQQIPEIAFEGSQHSPAVEALRTIRTNIRLAHPDVNAKSILVTSSLSQEGKTTVSANIAVSFALAGRRTLLVDTDMRKPRVHKLFGIDNKEGISTHMLGEKGIEEVLRRNVYQGLDVLLCGPIPPNPAEMMESKRFRDMADHLRELYDIIIFDSPPIIAVSDAAILSAMIDGVVVVVKIRQVSRDILKRSVSQLTKSNALLLGAVVNNLDLKGGGRYGSYYYYYHEKYRYYGETQEKKPA